MNETEKINATRKYNYLMRVQAVMDIVNKYYVPNTYARSYKKIWKNFVYPKYPMSYRTMLNYLNVIVPKEIKQQFNAMRENENNNIRAINKDW